MNWKEFLKPDWRKIIIFLVVLSIFSFTTIVFLFMNEPLTFFDCFPKQCSSGVYDELHNIYVWRPFLSEYLPISLVIIYLLSCFIIWIYDKVKKK